MSSSQIRLIAGAIVCGFALVALALYLAFHRPAPAGGGRTASTEAPASTPAASPAATPLRQTPGARLPSQPSRPLVPSAPSAALAATDTAQPQPPSDVVATGELEKRVASAAHDALVAQGLLATCWDPAVKKTREPATSKHVYDLTFDADGSEIARGISELRGESRNDVANCLNDHYTKLQIAAPGQSVHVLVTLTFP